MSARVCRTCGFGKPLTAFAPHKASRGGLMARCRDCVRAKDKARRSTPGRLAWRRGYHQRPERRAKENAAASAHRRRRPDQKAAANRRYNTAHPNKRRAQLAVCNAVRDGRLTRLPCDVCGNPKSQGHHDDYAKPLDVRWLCHACHTAHHRGLEPEDVLG